MKLFSASKTILQRQRVMHDLGFEFDRKATCPWTLRPNYKHRGFVFSRGEERFCVACMHGFLDHPDVKQGWFMQPDPKMLEEVGGAFYPPPHGFRLMPDFQIVDATKYESLMAERTN